MARCCSAPGSRSSWWISTRVHGSVTSWSRCSASSPIHPSASILFIVVVTLVLLVCPVAGEQTCEVHVGDQELGFPLDKMERQALCRLAGVVNDPTTSHVNPPIVTPVRKAIYDFLLDHMVLTAALVRQLALGDYRVHQVGTQGFFGDDGQGSEALFDLLYLAPTQRVYHVQGSHHGKVFSLVTGEAIVLLTSQPRSGDSGKGSVETQMAVYSRLDNPVLATLVKVLQPLLRGAINEKLAGPFLAVHRLGELIRRSGAGVQAGRDHFGTGQGGGRRPARSALPLPQSLAPLTPFQVRRLARPGLRRRGRPLSPCGRSP